MGSNTTLVILNDALHNIKEDKEFGQKVHDAVLETDGRNRRTILYSGNGNCGETVECHHADDIMLIAVGGNSGELLGYIGSYRLYHDKNPELAKWKAIKRLATQKVCELNKIKVDKKP